MADVQKFREHAVIDADVSDSQLQMYLDAAKGWFDHAGVEESLHDGDPLYDLGVYQLATHFYERRSVSLDGGADTLPYGINGIVLQLR